MLSTRKRTVVAVRSRAVILLTQFVGRVSRPVQIASSLYRRLWRPVLRITTVGQGVTFRKSHDRFANSETRLRRLAACCVFLCLLAGCTGASDAAAKQTVPAPDHDLLKRFVDDCVLIEPGTEPFPKQFQIGSKDEPETTLPPGDVVMPIRFRISKYETTQDLYESVMQKNPSRWKGPRNSVETITFLNAEECCVKLTAFLHNEKLIGLNEVVRLPTEAEWEYCCRAGTTTRYSFGDVATAEGDNENQASVLSDYAWHTGNAAGNDPTVGSLKPNPWQLSDIHGYLWEFVSAPHPTAASGANEPPAETSTVPPPTAGSPQTEARCIIRGGSWQDHHSMLTSASRRSTRVSRKSDAIGFRCVIADKPQAK